LNFLALKVGERNIHNLNSLEESAEYIRSKFESFNLSTNFDQFSYQERNFVNVVATLKGCSRADEVIVIGAHYDSVPGSPGANDNGTGVAALLEIAALISAEKLDRTVHFVAFVNEESPYFASDGMGSQNYARTCRTANLNIKAMFSLETMGYYSDKPGSQKYPPGVTGYPDQGNFIAFVGNPASSNLLEESTKIFEANCDFPFEKIAAPEHTPGVSLSDHMCFWQMKYQAVMITDTAPFRYPYYHTAQDLPDKINMSKFTNLVSNLAKTFSALAGIETLRL